MFSKIRGIGLYILKSLGIFILFYFVFVWVFEGAGVVKEPIMYNEFIANKHKIDNLKVKEQTYSKATEKAKKQKEMNDLKNGIEANQKEISTLNKDIDSIKSKLK